MRFENKFVSLPQNQDEHQQYGTADKEEKRNWHLPCNAQGVCHTDSVINRYGMKELTNWVDMPLPEKLGCFDMDERKVISDESVRMEILKHCGASNITEFMLHSKERQKDIIRDVMRELGAGPRQMSRISGMPYTTLHKIWEKM